MKFFEAVPDELFSPLASPNRALYADALDVLCMAYRQKLRLPEDELYSMLRSRLEQQLADATFEGEDIDENELRDISGSASFLIRKQSAKGWFEKERGPDFREYITVPGYASRLLELFHELRDDRPARGFSYVFGTYSALRVADETGSAYEKMAAVYTAFDNTQALIRLLAAFPAEIAAAAEKYDPARITRYCIDVASAYHRFYNACRILDAEGTVQQGRIALCLAVRGVIHNILTMFKVNAPETM